MIFSRGWPDLSRKCLCLVRAAAISGLICAAAVADRSGGDATVIASDRNAFSLPSANMPMRQRLDFSVGNSFFRNPWVAAPASTAARDGLGPLFNTNACQNCHIKDGRGHTPQSLQDNAVSLLVRLSIPATGPLPPHQANVPEPRYGGQLQDFALPGLAPEARIQIHYTTETRTLRGGETVELRRPVLTLADLAYGEMHADTRTSIRLAPPVIGLGLLEAIDAARLRQLADPQDSDGDGISGKVNQVWDRTLNKIVPGRFGWKAGQPSVAQQSAAAFNGDMGITSHLFPDQPCTAVQQACRQAPGGESADGGAEVSRHILDQVVFYTQNLAVPARRKPNDAVVKRGEGLFVQIGCADCHTPSHTTRSDYPLAWLANQSISPYTDLLLHDMGEDLADHTVEFEASGREWRTPPLWGIGLTKVVSGHENYLHDGRARTLQEAILWHGGEGLSSRNKYSALTRDERQALLRFLRDL